MSFTLHSCSTSKNIITESAPPKIDPSPLLTPEMTQKYTNTITEAELSEHLHTFASDAFEGRETGTRGQKMAASYLSNEYKRLGLEGPVMDQANPYLQPIPFIDETTSYGYIKKDDLQLDNGTDFYTQAYSKNNAPSDVVFVGYGMEAEDYNDYEGLDVRGKAIVAILGEPMDINKRKLSDMPQEKFLNRKNLEEKGITDLFITFANQRRYDAQMSFMGPQMDKLKPIFKLGEGELEDRGYNLYFISPSKAAELFDVTPDQFFKSIRTSLDKKKTLGGMYSTSDVEIVVERPKKFITSENVAAYLPGRDLKDELLVISSHYDHVGIIDGKIYNGADDDGSGSMAVLEIAEAFATAAKEGNGPRRSVLFLNVTGEEKGLWGSEYYADIDPLYPLENTIANLNIDMIGRNGDERTNDDDYVYVIGSDMLSTELHAVHENVSSTYFPDVEMDYLYNGKDHPQRFYYRSDHYNFAKNNIPVIFYFNGTHEDYHQHTEDVTDN